MGSGNNPFLKISYFKLIFDAEMPNGWRSDKFLCHKILLGLGTFGLYAYNWFKHRKTC